MTFPKRLTLCDLLLANLDWTITQFILFFKKTLILQTKPGKKRNKRKISGKKNKKKEKKRKKKKEKEKENLSSSSSSS